MEMQKEMIAEIEADRPEFVVFVNVPMSFGRLTGSETLIFSCANAYLAPSVPKGGNGGYEPAVRVHLGIRRPSISAAFAIVYRRFQKKTECGLVLSDP